LSLSDRFSKTDIEMLSVGAEFFCANRRTGATSQFCERDL